MNSNTRILGFDYGSKRIGIATGNTITATSQPLITVLSTSSGPDWREIEKIINEWKPGLLVVGLPISMDSKETDISRKARKFGASLSGRFKLDVIYVDERLTSTEADRIIKNMTPEGKKISKKHISMRDNLAAQLILETYFEDN
jgi:putative Holliday junction resolvase